MEDGQDSDSVDSVTDSEEAEQKDKEQFRAFVAQKGVHLLPQLRQRVAYSTRTLRESTTQRSQTWKRVEYKTLNGRSLKPRVFTQIKEHKIPCGSRWEFSPKLTDQPISLNSPLFPDAPKRGNHNSQDSNIWVEPHKN